MSRSRWVMLCAALSLLVTGVWCWGQPQAEPAPAVVAKPPAPPAPPLPVRQVTLFNSGVGFFQREADVLGNESMTLTVPAADVSDLLKSLVVRDQNGGRLKGISCDTAQPVAHALRSFAFNLVDNPTLGELLDQARGERLQVSMPATASQPGTFTGTLISLENRLVPGGKTEPIEAEFVNLLTATGLKSLRLDQAEEVRLLNPRLDAELKQALATLARSHDGQKRNLAFHFTGEGRRKVRLGYLIEQPMWKSSYRLTLDGAGQAELQAWALLENLTDEDWQDVQLTLVAGQPISFRMDLHEPLYPKRPTVELETYAPLRPPSYESAFAKRDRSREQQGGRPGAPARIPMGMGGMGGMGGGMTGMGGGGMFGIAESLAAGSARRASRWMSGRRLMELEREQMDLGAGGEAMQPPASSPPPEAQSSGNYCKYELNQTVSIPRQSTSVVPLASRKLKGSAISIFNSATHPRHPLLGFKLKNTSDQPLQQGPITVFDAGGYAGEARLDELQAGEERLISFALDPTIEVKEEQARAGTAEELISLKLVKGVLERRTRLIRWHHFTLMNRGTTPRAVLLEVAREDGWRVAEPKERTEESRGHWRFQVPVPVGQAVEHQVRCEKEGRVTWTLTSASTEAMMEVALKEPVASAALKEALRKALGYRQALADMEKASLEAEQQLKGLREEQSQARENLKVLPTTSAAYRRFLEKIDSLQNDLEKTQEQLKKLRAEEVQQRRVYDAFLANLTVE